MTTLETIEQDALSGAIEAICSGLFVRLQAADDELLTIFANKVAGALAEPVADILMERPTSAEPPGETDLLTLDEVLEARPGLTRSWLYENSARCGAIRKNDSKRSPLWFRLRDVDAAIERRRKTTDEGVAPAAPSTSRPHSQRRRAHRAEGLTPHGSPRRLEVIPPKES